MKFWMWYALLGVNFGVVGGYSISCCCVSLGLTEGGVCLSENSKNKFVFAILTSIYSSYFYIS